MAVGWLFNLGVAGLTTVKGEIYNSLGQVWNTSGTPIFQTYSAVQIANYAAASGVELGASGIYSFTVPAGISMVGLYTLVPFIQAGGAHAEADQKFTGEEIDYDGAAVVFQTGDSFARIGALGAGLTSVVLAAAGLDAITVPEPTTVPTTFPGWFMWLIRRFAPKGPSGNVAIPKSGNGNLIVYASNGITVITTQAVTDDGVIERLGPLA